MNAGSPLLRRGLAVVGVGVAVAVSSGCATTTSTGAAESADPITLRVADILAENTSSGLAWKAFADAVSEDSGGEIDFEFNWSGSLMAPDEVLSGLGAGVADMSVILPVYTPNELPVANWVAGLATTDLGFPAGLLQGVGAHAQAILESDVVVDEFAANGVRLLTPAYANQFFEMVCKEPVASAKEVQGIDVRTPGQLWADEASHLGMTPVPLAPTEIFEGLQRGVIDCAIAQPSAHIGYGLWEVAPYYIPLPFTGWNTYYLSINDETWDSLSPEHQSIIADNMAVWVTTYAQEQINSYRTLLVDGASEHGVQLVAPSADLVAQLQEFQSERTAVLADTAPAAISDPEEFLQSYEDTMTEWAGIVIDDLGIDAPPIAASDTEALTEAFTAEYDLARLEEILVSRVYSTLTARP